MEIKLIDDKGYLALPNRNRLMYIYPAGDMDMVKTVRPRMEHLIGAMFDARETGEIESNINVAILPDDRKVSF